MCKLSELLRIDEMFSKRNQKFDSFLANEESGEVLQNCEEVFINAI